MHGIRSGPRSLFSGLAIVAMVATACNSSVSPSASSAPAASTVAVASATPAPAITPAPIDTDQPGPNGGVVIRWFVGLGAGGQPQQFAAEQAFVDKYNSSQKDVYISLEIYNNNVAADILKTQIAAGNAPDIIGPVCVEGLNLFRDQLLDLKPLIASSAFDMTKFDPGLRTFFDLGENGATIGVPFATYPSFLWYNKALFDEAKLPLPPTKVGEQYQGKTWDMAALRELAMKLTVDTKGNECQSGNLAMDETHSWYSCCVNPAPPAKPIVKDFGWAITPSYNGKITAKLHADTFSHLKSTKHPDAAFKALATLASSGELL